MLFSPHEPRNVPERFVALIPKVCTRASAITLHRTDLAKNMRRFYRLDWQRDLSRRP
jgi:hypothetical protein